MKRRTFLIGSGIVGGGLILGVGLGSDPLPQTAEGSFQPNAWLQITPDGRVVFQLDKAEMGQGVFSSLPTILAEALDYDPARMTVEMAGVHSAYNNPALRMQVTGGSTSVNTAFAPLQEAGASARAMLMQAAANRWQVPATELETDNGVVIHSASGRRATYAELAEAAKEVPLPQSVELKPRSQYKWLGKSQPRLDSPAKIDGSAQFGVDVQLPGMKVAVVLRCPHFGGRLRSFDAGQVLERPGVEKVFAIHNGVAVVADGYWQARQAANVLSVEWDKGPLAGLNSAAIRRHQEQALDNGDTIVEALVEGDADGVWQQAQGSDSQVLEAVYAAPFLHHSTMEPQNCTALVNGDRCEIWAPSQAPGFVQALAAQFGGFDRDKVTVHTTLMGGGFGRRAMTDFAGEAAAIAAQMPGVPIKLMWSREDDMQHDFYRPSTLHRLRAVVADGQVQAWRHRVVSASITKGMAVTLVDSYLPRWLPEAMARGIGRFAGNATANRDTGMAEGAEIPYAIANKKVDVALYDPGIPLGFWRSVGHSHNAFVVESFVDEVAQAAGKDPLDLRRSYLQDHPRHLGVMEAAARAANWGEPQDGRYQGLAVHESFKSYAAQVVELSRQEQGYKIERIVCAVDCGFAVNPDVVVEQVESAIIYGLSAALKPALSIEDGRVVQSNFHDLPVLRIDETPPIEVVLVDSEAEPTGIGEIALPPLAPALANALFAASGKRQRELPLSLSL